MIRNRWLGLGLAMLCCAVLAWPVYAETKTTAIVDLQTALNSVNRGIKAKELLKVEVEKKTKELEKKRVKIEKMREKLALQASTYSPDVLKTKQMEFQKEAEELLRARRDMNEEVSQREMKYTQGIIEDMRAMIQQIAVNEKYDVVYEKSESGILYIKDSTDITSQLIDKFNKKYK